MNTKETIKENVEFLKRQEFKMKKRTLVYWILQFLYTISLHIIISTIIWIISIIYQVFVEVYNHSIDQIKEKYIQLVVIIIYMFKKKR